MKRVMLCLFVMVMALSANSSFAYAPPRAADLLFSAVTDGFPATPGAATGAWATTVPAGGSLPVMASPTVDVIRGKLWERNLQADGDGYNYGTVANPIPCPGGASIVVAIRPLRAVSSHDWDWDSIVDVLYDQMVLGIQNWTGQVTVRLAGVTATAPANTAIPNGQITVLSLVVQSDGSYIVWANGTQVLTGAAIAGGFTQLTRSSLNTIGIGRNTFDGWSTFNGNIGDVFVYTAALSDTDRQQLESDITAKFGTASVYTITASAGTGGTVSPSGVSSIAEGLDQAYTITPAIGYAISDVLVDGVSAGPITTYAFTNVTANHTISASFYLMPTGDVSGRVTDQASGAGLPGATVYFSPSANAPVKPTYTVTTDSSGNYTTNIPVGTWYVSASHSTHVTAADQTAVVSATPVTGLNFPLASSGRNIPAMDKLLVSAVTSSLPDGTGTATGPWATFHPLNLSFTPMGTPTVDMIGTSKWEQNLKADSDGYVLGTYSTAIPCSGASIVTVVKPVRNTIADPWNSIVDVFWDRLSLGIKNDTGQVSVRRNSNWGTDLSTAAIPDGQTTILSLVVQPTGEYKVYANGAEIMNQPSNGPMTALVPNVMGGWANAINIGRNNSDAWNSFNGDIGDVFIYKAALTDAQRQQLEADLSGRFLSNVTGKVVDSGGIPVAGASVDIMDVYETVIATTTTAADGTYSIIAPTLGTWKVRAYKLGYDPYPTDPIPVTVSNIGANAAGNLVINKMTTTTLDGHVLDDAGLGVVGATVEVRLGISGPVQLSTTSGTGGYYSFNMPVGFAYVVSASAPKHAKSGFVDVIVEDYIAYHQDLICKDLSQPLISVTAADATTAGWVNHGIYGGRFEPVTANNGTVALGVAGPATDLRKAVNFGNGALWVHLMKDGAPVLAGPEIAGNSAHTVIAWVFDPIPSASSNSQRDAYISWAPQGAGGSSVYGMYLGLGWQVWGSAVCGYDAGPTPTINWTGSNGTFATALTSSTAPWGRWAQVVTVYDGTGYKIYVDGVERTDMAKTFNTQTTPGYQIYLGGSANGTSTTAGRWGDTAFSGSIARLQMYAYPMSAAEIAADYAVPPTAATLVEVSTISELKAQPVGTLVKFTGTGIVTFAPRRTGARTTSFFYIEQTKGLGGIRVQDYYVTDNLNPGDRVANLIGSIMALPSGEKYLSLGVDAAAGLPGSPIPALGLNNKAVVSDTKAQTNYITVWGKVSGTVLNGTSVRANSFNINDGYGTPVPVNSSYINVAATTVGAVDGKTAIVTGIATKDSLGNLTILAQSVTLL